MWWHSCTEISRKLNTKEEFEIHFIGSEFSLIKKHLAIRISSLADCSITAWSYCGTLLRAVLNATPPVVGVRRMGEKSMFSSGFAAGFAQFMAAQLSNHKNVGCFLVILLLFLCFIAFLIPHFA